MFLHSKYEVNTIEEKEFWVSNLAKIKISRMIDFAGEKYYRKNKT